MLLVKVSVLWRLLPIYIVKVDYSQQWWWYAQIGRVLSSSKWSLNNTFLYHGSFINQIAQLEVVKSIYTSKGGAYLYNHLSLRLFTCRKHQIKNTTIVMTTDASCSYKPSYKKMTEMTVSESCSLLLLYKHQSKKWTCKMKNSLWWM